MLTFKDYPAATSPGLLNGFLAAPFELVLAQSFAFLDKIGNEDGDDGQPKPAAAANDPVA